MRLSPRFVALAVLAAPVVVSADPPWEYALPFLDDRPFLLLDAPRRTPPGVPASVRVQRAGGGPLQLAVYRLRALQSFVAAPLPREGVSVAGGPIGAEAEALLVEAAPLPRQGALVDLVALHRIVMRASTRVRRAVGDETAAYDSNESDEGSVDTWGVRSGAWAEQRVDLGTLPTGLYVVRALAGGWASSALVSVGSLTVLARRGNTRDTVVVTDGEGAPQAGVTVQRFVAGVAGPYARTDSQGRVDFDATDAAEARFVALRGDDVAWADVAHARLEPCDVRVYVGSGRPAFRPGETLKLRGHARGCVDGRDAPLRDEAVELRTATDGPALATARTDADGNFLADVPADGELYVRVRGRDHRRTLHLDTRPLPRHSLRLRFDRAWAAAGESVTVTAADDQGGWPDTGTVSFRAPGATGSAVIGPGNPARFTFAMPATDEALARRAVHAEMRDGATTTAVDADLWTGAEPALLELTSAQTQGATGTRFPLHVAARDLGGAARALSATLSIWGTDGNQPVGDARSTQALEVTAAGNDLALPLPGAGPWWIAVAPRDARASGATLVVWERPRPASLSSRGGLAVLPDPGVAVPGQSLGLTLRMPAFGATLVTLEQGGVWATRVVPPTMAGHVTLPVAEGARGLATVVATHVHAGEVSTASAAVEVETSRRLTLTAASDRRTYNAGAHAAVTLRARNTDGTPRDAVVSLWVSDAGWWDVAQEDHPSPDAWFRLPGNATSAGHSATPRGYGAEEGRHFPLSLEWNGASMPRSSFRHAWASTAEVVSFEARGDLRAIATRLAQAAGYSRADVCAEAVARAGAVHLRARNIPWNLVADRIAARTETTALVGGTVLRFDCGPPPQRSFGSGMGSGSGMGYGGGGAGVASRTQTLDGTVFFLGLRRLGPTGEVTVDVPLPDRPGRWRMEALAIADDGAGDIAHDDVTTTRAMEARIELPPSLATADEAEGTLHLEAAPLAGRPVTLALTAARGVRVLTAPPSTVTLDAAGRADVPVRVRAEEAGETSLTVEATGAGASDVVTLPMTVRAQPGWQPVRIDTSVGPSATDVELRVPALTAPATLEVRLDEGVDEGLRAVLASLREPMWQVPSLLVDRLRVARALRESMANVSSVSPGLHDDIERASTSAADALVERLQVSDGVGWWRRLGPDLGLTAEVFTALPADDLDDASRSGVLDLLRAGVVATTPPATLARVAAALATAPAQRPLARTTLDRVLAADADIDTLTWALRAARALSDDGRSRTAARRLAAALDRAVASDPSAVCRGAAWFLCFESMGDRAVVARGARELLRFDATERPRAVSALSWLARNPGHAGGPWWGTAEGEVVALQATLPSATGAYDATVLHEGRELARIHGHDARFVIVPGEGTVVIRFAAATDRALRLRVRGALPMAPPDAAVGPGALSHRIERTDGRAELVLGFTLPTAARTVTVTAPLSSAWVPGLRAGTHDVTATGGRRADRWGADYATWDWYALDRTPANQPPRVAYVDGALRVRYGALAAGRHTLRVPLSEVAHGSFHVGAAWMEADGGRVWSVAPAAER